MTLELLCFWRQRGRTREALQCGSAWRRFGFVRLRRVLLGDGSDDIPQSAQR